MPALLWALSRSHSVLRAGRTHAPQWWPALLSWTWEASLLETGVYVARIYTTHVYQGLKEWPIPCSFCCHNRPSQTGQLANSGNLFLNGVSHQHPWPSYHHSKGVKEHYSAHHSGQKGHPSTQPPPPSPAQWWSALLSWTWDISLVECREVKHSFVPST